MAPVFNAPRDKLRNVIALNEGRKARRNKSVVWYTSVIHLLFDLKQVYNKFKKKNAKNNLLQVLLSASVKHLSFCCFFYFDWTQKKSWPAKGDQNNYIFDRK